ncbi:hypothetical protein DMJ13_23615 [halophilic archaeon]|nr:hypothetical protein DMJ13_23615 [halophilic archaeon]
METLMGCLIEYSINMADGHSDRDDVKRELLEATGKAIAEHGVSDVTTQKVADEWGRSQSLVHYYYETKADLVVAYIEYLHDGISREYAEHAEDSPLERLERAVVRDICDGESQSGSLALFDLHGSAPFNDRYQSALNDLEAEARDFLETAIEDGIEAGTFRSVSPPEVATLLLSAHDGGILRTATLDRQADGALLESSIEQYVAHVLLTEEARTDWDGFDAEGD